MKEEKRVPETPETRSEGPEKPEPAADEKKPYVFKIAPADPKNAFDFEDVADK